MKDTRAQGLLPFTCHARPCSVFGGEPVMTETKKKMKILVGFHLLLERDWVPASCSRH